MVIGKIRGDDLSDDDDVVLIKPVESVERAIHHVSILTSSFYDIKVVQIVKEFKNAAAAEDFETSFNSAEPL
jgi:mevalonate pyrophosphate decarboxylase